MHLINTLNILCKDVQLNRQNETVHFLIDTISTCCI